MAGSSRPAGTDGYDFSYRMTVDDRYKKAAQGRVLLRKFVLSQVLLHILRATWACLGLLKKDVPNYELLISCAFGGVAVILGYLGSKGNSTLLKFYILATVVAVGLSLIPFASDLYVGKVNGDHQRVRYYTLEGVVELAGVLLQLISVLIAYSFMKNVSLPKKRV